MSFFGRHSCYSLTRVSVRQNAPARSGVYAISNASEWLFVGAADDIQSALYAHLAETGTPLGAMAGTGFTFQLCDAAGRNMLRGRLIADLRPACNQPPPPEARSSYSKI